MIICAAIKDISTGQVFYGPRHGDIYEMMHCFGYKVLGAPIFCKLHLDEKHTKLVRWCSYCEDFWCINHEEGAFD